MKICVCWMISFLPSFMKLWNWRVLFILLSLRYHSVWIPSIWVRFTNTDQLFLPLQFSSLLLLSQKYKTIRNPESWKPAISSTQHLELSICRIIMVFSHRHRAIKNYVQHGDLAGARVFRSSWPVTRFKVLPITGFQELMNMQPFTQMPCVCWYRHNLC